MDSESAQLARRYFEAVHRDPSTTGELYSPGAVLHYSGKHRLSGDYRGPAAILDLFTHSRASFGGTQTLEVHDVLGSADHAVALLAASAELGGTRVHWNRVVVFHVSGNRIVEQWILDDDQALLERILSG